MDCYRGGKGSFQGYHSNQKDNNVHFGATRGRGGRGGKQFEGYPQWNGDNTSMQTNSSTFIKEFEGQYDYRGGHGGRGGRGGRGTRGGRGGFLSNKYQRNFKQQLPPSGNFPYKSSQYKEQDLVAVKIRGLPFQTRYFEIADFFRDYKCIKKSAILGVGYDGRINGFGAILFDDAEIALKAATEQNGQYLGQRYVEISLLSYGDYLLFNGQTPPELWNGQTVKLSEYVGPDNQERALVMRGLPYDIQVDQIVNFFEGLSGLSDKTIIVEEFNGKRSGSALVVFNDEQNAQFAKQKYNKKKIAKDSKRYVELYDQNDYFMQKICNIFFEECKDTKEEQNVVQ